MSNVLSFDGATVETGGNNKYLSPGIHIVKVTEIKQGLSSQKSSPYVEVKVEDSTGAACSQQYYLTTTVKEGSTKSAWDISRNAILQLIMAVTGSDEATAKSKLVGITDENIATKLSAFMLAKPFAIHIAGKYVTPSDPAKKSWVKGEFGNYKFATTVARAAELKHDPAKHIKGTPVNAADPAVASGVVNNSSTPW